MMVENQWNTDATYSWVLLQLPLIINDSLAPSPPPPKKKRELCLSFPVPLHFYQCVTLLAHRTGWSVKAFLSRYLWGPSRYRKTSLRNEFRYIRWESGTCKKFLTVKLCSRSCRWREEIFHFLLLQYLSLGSWNMTLRRRPIDSCCFILWRKTLRASLGITLPNYKNSVTILSQTDQKKNLWLE